MNVRILTSDRYFPWNGESPEKRDRIWGDLDEETNIPFLVYSEGLYQGSEPEFISFKLSQRSVYYFIIILIKSFFYGIFKDRRLFLEQSPINLIRYFISNVVKKRSLSHNIFRWYFTYSALRIYFETNPIDVLVYHGEFNGWGIAISWACRDSGVLPIAHQHGPSGPDYQQYANLEPIVHYIAKALLLISTNQYEFFNNIPIKTYVAGSRRLRFRNKKFIIKEFDYLVIPTTTDTSFLQSELKRSNKHYYVKPHPLRKSNWNLDNVTILEDDVESLILRSHAVIATAGFSLIYAIRHKVPLYLINCKESRPDRYMKNDFYLEGNLDDIIMYSQPFLIEDDSYYKECKSSNYWEILHEVYEQRYD